MPSGLGPVEFRLLRDYIEQHSGIALKDEKAYLVESRLAGLIAEHGCPDYGSFYRLASSSAGGELRERIVDAMTTNETLWFRDGHPFAILREKLLPPLAEQIHQGRRSRVRIWSAASSTGQEPYSIAMEILEYCRSHPGVRPEHFEILATDISPSALVQARGGVYDDLAIGRGLPPAMKERYFSAQGQAWAIADEVKRMVTLKKFNLQDDMYPQGRFDAIFCRYVTIYFTPDFKRRVYEGFARLLSPAGFLVISAVENLAMLPKAFDALSHGGGAYYRCRS